ncbi:MAG TPA: hypothetical protein VNX68_12975 [Nitrosopumilaceae archaeon]|nr:hypothetical protein [Nitrosopumilaceae archaeon]
MSQFPAVIQNPLSGNVNAKGINVWSYNATAGGSNEASATVQGAGYFLSASGYMQVGDFILISCNDPVSHVINVATVNPGVAITVVQVA